MKKKVLILQLDETEQPGFISAYLKKIRCSFKIVKIFDKHSQIEINSYSHLIVLPSPKNTFDCDKYPFLAFAKTVIVDFMSRGKCVLGICMGCQLIAECLGEKVSKMTAPEVGFYKLNILTESPLTEGISNEQLKVFEWHSMEVSTRNAISVIADSNKCKTQIFQYKNNIFGIQFHLEINKHLVDLYLGKFDSENRYIFIKKMVKEFNNFKKIQKQILDNFLNLE